MLRAFQNPEPEAVPGTNLVEVEELYARYPKRPVVVFPECTTTNGRGILPMSPSILSAPPGTRVFPVSLRYEAADITTPIPKTYFTFLWNLLSRPSHRIRVRIAESVHTPNAAKDTRSSSSGSSSRSGSSSGVMISATSTPDVPSPHFSGSTPSIGSNYMASLNDLEEQALEDVATGLAKQGKVQRVHLSVKDKVEFVAAWNKRKLR